MKIPALRRAVVGAGLLAASAAQAQGQQPQLGTAPIPEVVKAMTLEEKANLVVGNGFYLPDLAKLMPQMLKNLRPEQKKIVGTAGTTYALPKYNIASLAESDGPSGINVYYQSGSRTYYATAWPSPELQACSWDTALVHRIGRAYGHEAKEYGLDIPLAPALNLHRNPLGGRNFEYYSEDPLVSGRMATAMVQGLQSQGIGSSIKHFAANNQEFNRNTLNTIVSERALRELYLRGFEIAIKEAQPWTVMSSYNKINGTYTSESRDLLTTILRDEWGFKGFVMTDWFSGTDPVAQQRAGNDLLMPGKPEETQKIIAAVQSKALPESVLDENVARILRVMLQAPSFKKYAYADHTDLAQSGRLAREAAAQSMVLLKNNAGTLPLSSRQQLVSLFGSTSYDLLAGGSGSGTVNATYKVSLADGLTRAGYTLEQKVQQAYAQHVGQELLKRPKQSFMQQFAKPYKPIAELPLDSALLVQSAKNAGVALVSFGRVAGEGTDRKPEDFYLTDAEKSLLKRVSTAFHAQGKKVVVVLNVTGVVDVAQWRDQVDAIVLAWLPGQEGGNALADVLSGQVNPSGKLASTFPLVYTDDPTAKNFPGKALPVPASAASTGVFTAAAPPAEVTYEEGVYVGYRYYNTFGVKPAYEFGYGLSYTTFGYGPLTLSAPTFSGSLTATVTVTNTGKVAGREVAQLYLAAPKGKLDKPSAELKGFAKTGLLQPGQSQTLTFTLQPHDLASFNTKASAWVADAGTYAVRVGASSLDVKGTASFKLAKELVVEKTHKSLTPQVAIKELQFKK